MADVKYYPFSLRPIVFFDNGTNVFLDMCITYTSYPNLFLKIVFIYSFESIRYTWYQANNKRLLEIIFYCNARSLVNLLQIIVPHIGNSNNVPILTFS